jgi:molybdopterin converting factor small subunit
VLWKLANLREQHAQRIKEARATPGADVEALEYGLVGDRREYEDWLAELNSTELVRKAEKMDIYLDDIPPPEPEERADRDEYDTPPEATHWVRSQMGTEEFLCSETRKELHRRMRERAPAYRKERRERIRLIVSVITALTGLAGTIAAVLAVLHKK